MLVRLSIISVCYKVCHMCSAAILRLWLFTKADAVQAMMMPLQQTPTHLGTRQTPLRLEVSPLPLLETELVCLPLPALLLPHPHLVEPPPAQLLPQLRARAGPLLVPRALLRAKQGRAGSRPRLPLLPGPHLLLSLVELTCPPLLSASLAQTPVQASGCHQ